MHGCPTGVGHSGASSQIGASHGSPKRSKLMAARYAPRAHALVFNSLFSPGSVARLPETAQTLAESVAVATSGTWPRPGGTFMQPRAKSFYLARRHVLAQVSNASHKISIGTPPNLRPTFPEGPIANKNGEVSPVQTAGAAAGCDEGVQVSVADDGLPPLGVEHHPCGAAACRDVMHDVIIVRRLSFHQGRYTYRVRSPKWGTDQRGAATMRKVSSESL
jgi:hypothetical protein